MCTELNAFLGWVLGSGGQAGVVSFGSSRSFRRRTAWCWNIAPGIPATGEIHDQIPVDGMLRLVVLPDCGPTGA